jgi:hypothetical protein
MPSVVIIEKNCDTKTLNLKTFVEEELYKKCNFKNGDDFKVVATWVIGGGESTGGGVLNELVLYGKTKGRANHENKFEFPPPVDNTLFFGSCVLVLRRGGVVVDLTIEKWKEIYNNLMGGFDDTADTETESEEELPKNPTKQGYEKDDFVVDDDDDTDEEEEEEPPAAALKKRGRKRKEEGGGGAAATAPRAPRGRKSKSAATIAAEVAAAAAEETVNIYDEAPELSEEEYTIAPTTM